MKLLVYVNLLGVLALAGLCALQWRVNRAINLRANALDRTRLEQARQLEDQAATITSLRNDVEDFRDRLAKTREELDQTEHELTEMTAARDKAAEERDHLVIERDRLTTIRDELQKTIETWSTAVNDRDNVLGKLNDDVAAVAKQRDDATTRFNELAVKYNALVKQVNASHGK